MAYRELWHYQLLRARRKLHAAELGPPRLVIKYDIVNELLPTDPHVTAVNEIHIWIRLVGWVRETYGILPAATQSVA